MSFMNAMQETLNNEFNVSVTENGACGYKSSGAKLLDINFAVSSLRSKSDGDISKMFSEAFYENPLLAVKWLFMLRDIRGNGMGERRSFRVCFKWLATVRPELVQRLVKLVSEYGRFDDLFCLVTMKNDDKVENEVLGVIERVIRKSNYYLMFRCVSTYHDVSNILKMWNVDGAIFLGMFASDIKEKPKGHNF